jgi:hypothetical protein
VHLCQPTVSVRAAKAFNSRALRECWLGVGQFRITPNSA